MAQFQQSQGQWANNLEKVDYETDFNYQSFLSETNASLRLAFLRRVYGVLTLQLLWTTFLVGLAVTVTPIHNFFINNSWMMWVTFGLSLALLFAVKIKQKEYPSNMFLLFAWTTSLSLMLCTSLAAVPAVLLIEAAGITLAAVCGLTAFAFTTKTDFSIWKGSLYSSLWGLIFASILLRFLPGSSVMALGMSVIGAILFSAYIVFDTQQMMTKKSYDDWVDCSIELYLDIINLFLYILRILAASKRN